MVFVRVTFISATFISANNRTGCFNGDFDYSGTQNFDDYALIDAAFLS